MDYRIISKLISHTPFNTTMPFLLLSLSFVTSLSDNEKKRTHCGHPTLNLMLQPVSTHCIEI